jgi:iron complex transport system permease protein
MLAAMALVASIFVSLCSGSTGLSVTRTFHGFIEGSATPAGRIIYFVRAPRTLAAVLAGAALAVSGAVLQNVLANPLASSGTIGVNAGAGFGAALCGVFFPFSPALPAGAFFGALLTILIVYELSRRVGAARVTLVLAGVAISSLMNAATNSITTLVPDALPSVHAFQVGGLSGVSLKALLPAGLYILFAFAALIALNGELDILTLGDESAESLGLNARKYRFAFLTLAAVLTGAAVSFAGLIGFVGLIAPHVARIIIGGGDSKALIIMSALCGAAFLTLCDTAARAMFAPFELQVGVIVAFIGAPFFLWLLFSGKGRRKL